MKVSKLEPLFAQCIRASCACTAHEVVFPRQNAPLECQVLALRPRLLISDGFHTVFCELSTDGLILFKKKNATTRVSQLKGRRLILQQYAPRVSLLTPSDLALSLVIYAFVLGPSRRGEKKVFNSTPALSTSAEMSPVLDLARKRLLKRAIETRETVNALPRLEEVPRARRNQHFGEVVVRVDEEANGEAKERFVDFGHLDTAEKEALVVATRLIQEEQARRRKRGFPLAVCPKELLTNPLTRVKRREPTVCKTSRKTIRPITRRKGTTTDKVSTRTRSTKKRRTPEATIAKTATRKRRKLAK